MKKTFTQSVLLITLGIIFAGGGGHLVSAKPNNPSAARNRSQPPSKIKKIDEITTNLHNKMQSLPVLFEENKGQFGERIKFLSRGKGFNVLLNANETVFQMPDANCGQRKPAAKIQTSKPCKTLSLTMKMLGANTNAETRGIDEAVTKSGYFIGNDQSRWRNEISNFKAVRFEQIYQGIDVIFRGAEQNLEYDFHIAPNADPNLIQLEFGGIKKVKIDKNGDLIFKFKGIVIRHHQPVAYQMIDGQRQEVSAKFVSLGNNKIGFAVGKYDQTKELIIDPLVTEELPNDSIKYATYLGGSRQDSTQDIAIDSAGYIYLASGCASEDFLDLDGEVNTSVGRESDICVTKLNSEGTQIIYNVVVGGLYYETPWAIDVDNSGNVYVGGETSSPDFPMVNARQTTNSIIDRYYIEGFVFKLNSSGNSLAYSTYHGATTDTNDWVESVDVDANGNLYAVGSTAGSDFPLRNGFQMSANGSNFDAFLSKFSPSGELLYSTLFGSRQSGTWTIGSDVAVDNNGFAYLSGEVSGTSQLPVTAGAYKTGGTDGFVAKFNTNNTGSSSLVYATYTNSLGQAIAIDSNGNAVTAGGTSYSAEFGEKLNSAGTGAIFTFTTNGEVRDIAIDDAGNSYFIEDAHLIEGYFRSTDVKVTGYSPTGNLLGTTIIKGEYRDTATGIALDSNKRIFVVGYTGSRNFPTTENALQPQSRYAIQGGSSVQGFLARVELEPPRNPLIFIPGTMGSELYRKNPDGTIGEKYWVRVLSSHTFNPYLTLDPQSIFFVEDGFVAKDAVRKVYYDQHDIIGPDGVVVTSPPETATEIYYPFLTALKEKGRFKEYDLSEIPPTEGCDTSQISIDDAQNPNLFVFPYDFRQDNAAVSAVKLKAFVQCVRQFYPDKKVDIIGHSQGGLVASRYIFQNPDDHNIGKLITIATPFLGAPKAIYALEKSGDWSEDWAFSLGVMSPPEIKFLSEHFKSVHQLLPSRSYFELTGNNVVSENGDVNLNGIFGETFYYDQFISLMNNDFPSTLPGDVGRRFHDTQAGETFNQDNWNNLQNGVEYHQIIGEQYSLNTPTSMTIDRSFRCGIVFCGNFNTINLYRGLGDATVPTISASRVGYRFNSQTNQTEQINLNAPNSNRWYLYAQNEQEDESVEHNGLHQNSDVQDLTLYILGLGQKPPGFERNVEEPPDQSSLTAENNKKQAKSYSTKSKKILSNTVINAASRPPETHPESYYLDVSGISGVYLRDQDGNFTGEAQGIFFNQARGVTYDVIGDDQTSLVLSPSHSYTVRFQTGNLPFLIKFVKGVGNRSPNSLTVFQDVSLPQGTQVKLNVNPQGMSNLLYDSNNDGTFDSEITPTVNVSGANAKDIKPPTAAINVVQQGSSATVTIAAQDDLSGVKDIRYSLDGQTFNYYTSPFTINYTQNPVTIYTFADDNVANRSGVFTKLFTFAPIGNPTLAVKPVLECVVANTNGTFTAKFGYENYNSVPVEIPLDEKNKFTPVPKNRGQVTTFQVGRVVNAFSVIFTENNLKWHLTGPDGIQQNVSASRNSIRCQY